MNEKQYWTIASVVTLAVGVSYLLFVLDGSRKARAFQDRLAQVQEDFLASALAPEPVSVVE